MEVASQYHVTAVVSAGMWSSLSVQHEAGRAPGRKQNTLWYVRLLSYPGLMFDLRVSRAAPLSFAKKRETLCRSITVLCNVNLKNVIFWDVPPCGSC
jgi:hypothetical protein